jgi:hypothetical protein
MPEPLSSIEIAAQQLGITIERLRGDLRRLEQLIDSQQKLANLRLEALERQAADQEQRLRSVGESAAQFKLLFGLTSGGSALASLAALWKSLWG